MTVGAGEPGPDVLDIDLNGMAGDGSPPFNEARRAGLVDGALRR